MQQGNQGKVIGSIISTCPKYFGLVRQAVPYLSNATFKQCRKSYLVALFQFRAQRVESKNRLPAAKDLLHKARAIGVDPGHFANALHQALARLVHCIEDVPLRRL